MKKALVLLTVGFAFIGTVGCSSAPTQDSTEDASASTPVAASETQDVIPAPAPMDEPKAEPIAETPAPSPMISEPPVSKSPSLGASSSGRGH